MDGNEDNMIGNNVRMQFSDLGHHVADVKGCVLRQYEKQQSCDITLVVNGSMLMVHRSVLCAFSPYFQTMFRFPCKEKDNNAIDFSETFMSVSTLKNLIDYVYTGNVVISGHNIYDILDGATMMMLFPLKGHCEQFLLRSLSSSNIFEIYQVAEMHLMNDLYIICQKVIECRFYDSLINGKEILTIPAKTFFDLINQDHVKFLTDDKKTDLVLKWALNDYSSRKIAAEEMIMLIFQNDHKMALKTLSNINNEVLQKTSDLVASLKHTIVESDRASCGTTELGLGLSIHDAEKLPADNTLTYSESPNISEVMGITCSENSIDESDYILFASDNNFRKLALFSPSSQTWVTMNSHGKAPVGCPQVFTYPYLIYSQEAVVSFHNVEDGSLFNANVPSATVTEAFPFVFQKQVYCLFKKGMNMMENMYIYARRNYQFSVYMFDWHDRRWRHRAVICSDRQTVNGQHFSNDVETVVCSNDDIYIMLKTKRVTRYTDPPTKLYFCLFDPKTNSISQLPQLETPLHHIRHVVLHRSQITVFMNGDVHTDLQTLSDHSHSQLINANVFDISNHSWCEMWFEQPYLPSYKGLLRVHTMEPRETFIVDKQFYVVRDIPWAQELFVYRPILGEVVKLPSPPLRQVDVLSSVSVGTKADYFHTKPSIDMFDGKFSMSNCSVLSWKGVCKEL